MLVIDGFAQQAQAICINSPAIYSARGGKKQVEEEGEGEVVVAFQEWATR